MISRTHKCKLYHHQATNNLGTLNNCMVFNSHHQASNYLGTLNKLGTLNNLGTLNGVQHPPLGPNHSMVCNSLGMRLQATCRGRCTLYLCLYPVEEVNQ